MICEKLTTILPVCVPLEVKNLKHYHELDLQNNDQEDVGELRHGFNIYNGVVYNGEMVLQSSVQ